MATKVSLYNIWLTPFDSPTPKIPYQIQISQRYLLYKPSYSRFSPKFRCHGNWGWSWQNCHHSIAWPWKPPIGRKHLRDISYTNRVIADFVPNFVAIATGVGRGRIWLASLNSPPWKPPVIHKDLADISYINRVIAIFVLNFVAMATGSSGGKFRWCR